MGGRIRRLNARQVELLLAQHGFELVSQKGSHRKWRKPESRLQVIVPIHYRHTVPFVEPVKNLRPSYCFYSKRSFSTEWIRVPAQKRSSPP